MPDETRDLVAGYVDELNEWIENLDIEEIEDLLRGQHFETGRNWSFSRFWHLTMDKGHTITQPTRRIVEKWITLLLDGTVSYGNYEPAGELIKSREIELKKGKS